MAYINVAEWTPDQVTDWLKGLDDTMYNYVRSFTNNEVGGRQLLNIRPYELEQLGMHKIGHQEIVLDAVENLRNFHYNLDKENLQFMALHVATAARSLHRQLAKHCDASKIETLMLNDITRTIGTIKPLIGWLDRAPFQGQFQFSEIRRNMLRLGLEMATIAQRDRFVERPVEQIRSTAEKLERLANYIIQDITDPMLLQPASLNLVTLKKRESELGFNIESSYHGIHRVTEIKYNSPAHNSGKIEDGDEIVQINYQTVVGWQYKTVLMQLRELLPDVLLTLKKRPKHTKIYGQIYMQPYRLPSKKRVMGSRWGENLPSPRAGYLTVPDGGTAFNIPLKSEEKLTTAGASDSDSSCSDILTPTDGKDAGKEIRLYYPKPRAMLQRRNTICGDELLGVKSACGLPLWHKRKAGVACELPASPSLRDKSVSFAGLFGIDITPRPTTCIGIASSTADVGGAANGGSDCDMRGVFKRLRQVPESNGELGREEPPTPTTPMASVAERSKPGVSKVVRFEAHMRYEDYPVDEKYTCNVENTILETFEPIPFADEGDDDVLNTLRSSIGDSDKAADIIDALEKASRNSAPLAEAINLPMLARRGRLDKSHSTPAYDNSGEEDAETPPAIEPRKEFLLQTPPVPPPRPRKQKDMTPPAVPPPPPKPAGLLPYTATMPVVPPTQMQSEREEPKVSPPPLADLAIIENANELHTPSKSRTLTLKKKHSLIAKRRNVNLKLLGTGDIQGHLYRRTKDRRGVTFWARLYFVMLDTILYGFRTKEAAKANCVLFLPGFTVSLAKEVHSKPHAFKVYHAAKTFYFATDSQDALNQWIEFIRNAAAVSAPLVGGHKGDCYGAAAIDVNTRELYSETESSGEESDESLIAKHLCTPSPQGTKDFGAAAAAQAAAHSSGAHGNTPTTSTAQASSSSSSNANTSTNTSKHDRSYLGSLRKLTKGSLHFKSSSSSSERKLPVPTEQYRSYRKVPGGSFGIQIGTNTPGYHNDSTLVLYRRDPSTAMEQLAVQQQQQQQQQYQQRKLSISSSHSSIVSNGAESTTSSYFTGPPASPAPVPTLLALPSNLLCPQPHGSISRDDSLDSPDSSSSKCVTKIPYNFIHASNPNLVEFDFQTSKTLDYSLPKINPSNSWDAHQHIQGFVTLKDLMLQKQEEEAQEMYNNRVLLGVEKKDEQYKRGIAGLTTGKRRHGDLLKGSVACQRVQQQQQQGSTLGGVRVVSKTQSRSLPKTPDYEISFKPDDEDIKRTRTKEGLKLRDFGYELISGDEPLGGTTATLYSFNSCISSDQQQQQYVGGNTSDHGAASSMKSRLVLRPQTFLLSGHKTKKHSSGSFSSDLSSSSTNAGGAKRAGSLKKKSGGKFEALKTSSEHLFQFSSGSSKHATMTLPLNKRSSRGEEGGNGIKKSHTYNNDLKEKAGGKYEAQRKNSAPVPIFGKLPFTCSSSSSSSIGAVASAGGSATATPKANKEKRLLGSPLLRRTIFGANSNNQHAQQQQQQNVAVVTPAPNNKERYDREIFSPVIFPKIGQHHSQHHQQQQQQHYQRLVATTTSMPTAPDVAAPPPPTLAPHVINASLQQQHQPPPLPPLPAARQHERTGTDAGSTPSSTVATPEYPNMECPPVFEPEIYSLTDADESLSLMLRRNNSAGGGGTAGTDTNSFVELAEDVEKP